MTEGLQKWYIITYCGEPFDDHPSQSKHYCWPTHKMTYDFGDSSPTVTLEAPFRSQQKTGILRFFVPIWPEQEVTFEAEMVNFLTLPAMVRLVPHIFLVSFWTRFLFRNTRWSAHQCIYSLGRHLLWLWLNGRETRRTRRTGKFKAILAGWFMAPSLELKKNAVMSRFWASRWHVFRTGRLFALRNVTFLGYLFLSWKNLVIFIVCFVVESVISIKIIEFEKKTIDTATLPFHFDYGLSKELQAEVFTNRNHNENLTNFVGWESFWLTA